MYIYIYARLEFPVEVGYSVDFFGAYNIYTIIHTILLRTYMF